MSPAEANCAVLEKLLTFPGSIFRQIHRIATMMRNPSLSPITGENTSPAITLRSPSHLRWLQPEVAMEAPTMPPISACELELGIPSHQVNRFQKIAEMTAAKTVRTGK